MTASPSPDGPDATMERFQAFLHRELAPKITGWYRRGAIPPGFFSEMGRNGWLGLRWENGRLSLDSCLRRCMVMEALAAVSPGTAIAALAHVDLGAAGVALYGTPDVHAAFGPAAAAGESVLCLGNTEGPAGSDVAAVGLSARPVPGGWRLEGAKAYVTNGTAAAAAVVTAVTDPEAPRTRRISMFMVDLDQEGVTRRKLDKRVWVPSDLTRLTFKDVFVPEERLLGRRGLGIRQVLDIFTHSRVPISALALGTARGAFEMGVDRAGSRRAFGRPILDFQAKAFEAADHYARMEAASLMVRHAALAVDEGGDFRVEASMAKYLAVDIARRVSAWAADLFGAVSVMFEHPIHKFPLDAWAASLGEGTQDVQKLIISRALFDRFKRS